MRLAHIVTIVCLEVGAFTLGFVGPDQEWAGTVAERIRSYT